MVLISYYDSPLGGITIASDGKAITGLWFDGQKNFGSTLPDVIGTDEDNPLNDSAYQLNEKKEDAEHDLPVFRQAKKWLDIYFSGKDPGFTPPLNYRGNPADPEKTGELSDLGDPGKVVEFENSGETVIYDNSGDPGKKGEEDNSGDLKKKMIATAFRCAVWEELLKIPFGETMTYKEIAERVAGKKECEEQEGVQKNKEADRNAGVAGGINDRYTAACARAVGGAVGHNPISLIIPCHRVLGADGKLTGYAGGVDKKASLLEMEGSLK